MTLATIQSVRKIVLLTVVVGGLALFAVGTCDYDHGGNTHWIVKWTGILALVISVLGRTWCALYIGGRKIEKLVTAGPYSMSRNPLYAFSIVGAVGAGTQFGSVVSGLAFGLLVFAVFRVVVAQEEKILLQRHGPTYDTYKASVPRFMPDLRLWRDVPVLAVRPRNIAVTFGDALLLMLFVPVSEVFEQLQNSGALPVLIRLP